MPHHDLNTEPFTPSVQDPKLLFVTGPTQIVREEVDESYYADGRGGRIFSVYLPPNYV